MNYYQILVTIVLCFTFTTKVFGQQLKENEIVVIRGEKYVLHQVRTGETIYSLGKKFKVDSVDIVTHNPQIADAGLKIGEILKIPYNGEVSTSNLPVYIKGDPTYFEYYTITSRRETPYFIAKSHGVTVEEIFAYNPEVEKFKIGIKIRIPRWEKPPEKEHAIETVTRKESPIEMIARKEPVVETTSKKRYEKDAEEITGIKETKQSLTKEPGDRGRDMGMSSSKYFEHTIVSGETLWSLSRKYGVTEEELIALNPLLDKEFPAGIKILVPAGESSLIRAEPVHEDAFEKHIVMPGETLYGLAGMYRVTIPDIKKYNPALEKRNLITGEIVLIPKTEEKEVVTFSGDSLAVDTVTVTVPRYDDDYYTVRFSDKIPDRCLPETLIENSDKVYNVVLFLPLFISDNEIVNRQYEDGVLLQQDTEDAEMNISQNDTLIEADSTKKFYEFYRDSENFIRFYEGVLLAVDSMQRSGMKIRLDVFDTQMKPDFIRSQINRINFLNTDLIIGPVYPQVQNEIALLASKNRVPMVSPLSSQSEVLSSNPCYYQVNPDRDFLDVKTAELIAEEFFNSNFIVFKTRSDPDGMIKKVPEMVRERLLHSGYYGQPDGFRFNIYDFHRGGGEGLSTVLSHDKENVIFIPSLDEGQVSVALTNINNFAGEYPITLIGFNRYQQFKSINIEHFHNLKLHYIAPYWVNYNDRSTISFIQKYRDYFYAEPNSFGIQGYDVTLYFLSALKNYGKDFSECISFTGTKLIQGDYRFEQVSRFGGYMNKGVSVIYHRPDYEVVRKRVMGQQNIAGK